CSSDLRQASNAVPDGASACRVPARQDAVGVSVAVVGRGRHATHRIADEVDAVVRDDPDRGARREGGAARIAHFIVADGGAISLHRDRSVGVAVEPVLLNDVSAPGKHGSVIKSADVAAANDCVRAVARIYPVSTGADPATQATNLEIIAVDRDVVGGDTNRVTGLDCRTHVLSQAPDALGADRGGNGVNETGAVVVAF